MALKLRRFIAGFEVQRLDGADANVCGRRSWRACRR
jgi:hypothetical protein